MIVNDKIVLLVPPSISRTHLIIQNLTDENLYILKYESVEKSDYINNGMCVRLNGMLEDYGIYKGSLYAYAANICDVRVVDL